MPPKHCSRPIISTKDRVRVRFRVATSTAKIHTQEPMRCSMHGRSHGHGCDGTSSKVTLIISATQLNVQEAREPH